MKLLKCTFYAVTCALFIFSCGTYPTKIKSAPTNKEEPVVIANEDLAYEIITPNGDGYQDQLILHYRFNTTGWTGQIDVLNYSGVTIHSLTPNTLFGQNGSISWDGFFDDQTKIPPGIYALWINAYHYQNQESKRKKIVFYINGKL